MKILSILLGLIIFYCLPGAVGADIYSWVDADGVRHFSNHAPPDGAKRVDMIEEIPYERPSAEEISEMRREEMLEEAREEIEEMKTESLERMNAAERKVEEARQKADQALREAEERLIELDGAFIKFFFDPAEDVFADFRNIAAIRQGLGAGRHNLVSRDIIPDFQ